MRSAETRRSDRKTATRLLLVATSVISLADASSEEFATMELVCDACAGLASSIDESSSILSSMRQRLFGAGPQQSSQQQQLVDSMSADCFDAVVRSCGRFGAASDETNPENVMRVMATLRHFSYCHGWIAAHPHEVSASQLERLVAWRERACGLHDEL